MLISSERVQELLDIEKRMRLLEAAGVDNWEGYDIAMESYEKELEIHGKIDDLVDSISEELCMHIETNVAGPNTGHGFYSEGLDELKITLVNWLEENTTIFQ